MQRNTTMAILYPGDQEIWLDESCAYQQDRNKNLRKLSARSEQLRHDLHLLKQGWADGEAFGYTGNQIQ